MRKTILVGRLTRKSSEIVVVQRDMYSPIPGPWTLRAMVRSDNQPAEPLVEGVRRFPELP